MFVTNEILYKKDEHKVSFKSVTFVKNDYADFALNFNEESEDEHSKNFQEHTKVESCLVEIINTTDNLSYAKTNYFSIKALRKTPETVSNAEFNDQSLPSSALDDNFKIRIRISCDNQVIEEFLIGKIDEILKLKDKKNTNTENRDIKLTSKDKKIVMFANFIID